MKFATSYAGPGATKGGGWMRRRKLVQTSELVGTDRGNRDCWGKNSRSRDGS